MWEKVEYFGDLAKRSEIDDGVGAGGGSIASTTHARVVNKSQASYTPSLTIDINPSVVRPLTAQVIQDYADSNPDEDVISFISYFSVRADSSKQWVPFGILPDREIARTLQCTVLVVTSPSFSVQDSKRFCTVAAETECWRRIRSLFIYGTIMGPSGLKNFVDLGLAHLKSLTIGQTRMTHHFGGFIGGQLMDLQRSVVSTSAASATRNIQSQILPETVTQGLSVCLQKIYIEQEPLFGDRGVEALLKCLQLNSTVQILALRACSITNRGAVACGRECMHCDLCIYF